VDDDDDDDDDDDGRFTGQGEAYRAKTAQEYFRAAFFACIDTAANQLSERLDKNSPGLKTYRSVSTHADNWRSKF